MIAIENTKEITNHDNFHNPIDIINILLQERIVIYFQPIVSTYQAKVAGLEALVRGIDESGELIPPCKLFEAATEVDRVVELDRLCQKHALKTFSENFGRDSGLILFMNVDNSVIHLHGDVIVRYVTEYGLSPKSIVLEINELQSQDDNDMNDVIEFTTFYRNLGFMISIDDIGSGFSNLDRIIALEPDIIKLDKEMVSGIHQHYFKQQVVDMIIKLAHKTGALIVAEGVEEIEEILTVLEFGAHFLQGFYISKPKPYNLELITSLNQVIRDIAENQKEFLSRYLIEKCNINEMLRDKFHQIKARIEAEVETLLDDGLATIIENDPSIECIYLINDEGMQVSDTLFRDADKDRFNSQKALFTPYKKGDNAKLKSYYYVLKTTHQDMYISEKYLSLATGSICITLSGYVQYNHEICILCLDVVT